MTEGADTTTTDYSGNYIYLNDSLQMISQPEGYIEPNNQDGFDYIYQYKDHLGNIRLTYKDDELYDTDFNEGIYSPWQASVNTTSMTIENDRLKVVTGAHLNGANGYYDLLAGETYEISVDVDRSLFTTDLEFSLWNGNSKIYGRYVTTSETVTYEYTPTTTATYRINFRLRDYGYAGGDQTFYLDNVIIRNTALALIEENTYYPFGLKHEGYNTTVTSNTNAIATKFKYNGKELNDELDLNLYDYGARFYDPALGRWHSPDPLSQFHSPYNYAGNNPINMIDPSGMWSYGTTYENGSDGFNEIMEEFGIGTNSSSEGESESGSPDDITVGSNGKVTKIDTNDEQNRFFDEDGNELKANDPSFDSQFLEGKFFIGDQVYTPISIPTLVSFLVKAGIVPPAEMGMLLRYLATAFNSHTSGDIGFTQIMKAYKEEYAKTEYAGNKGNGTFYVFGEQNVLYNLADAGNFAWGAWMNFNNFSTREIWVGSNVNSIITLNGIDTPADQRAIRNGSDFLKKNK